MIDSTRTLQNFMDGIVEASGFRISLYDLNYFSKEDSKLEIPLRLRFHCSEYCNLIKENPEAFKRCRETELERAELASTENGPILHTCHAGVTDLIMPLKRGVQLMGALYFGQGFLTACDKDSDLREKKLCKKFGFDRRKLRAARKAAPALSEEALRAWLRILWGVRDYIEQSEELMSVRQRQFEDFNTRTPSRWHLALSEASISRLPNPFFERLRPESEAIKKAVALLQAGYWKGITQAEVAKQIGLSASQFSRRFAKEVGHPFRTCQTVARIYAAGFLLKKTNYNLAQIADALGYANASSLQRAFTKHRNCTAREFIRSHPTPFAPAS